MAAADVVHVDEALTPAVGGAVHGTGGAFLATHTPSPRRPTAAAGLTVATTEVTHGTLMAASQFFFLHHFVDVPLPSGFVTLPRGRRQLWPLAALRRMRPAVATAAMPPATLVVADALVPAGEPPTPRVDAEAEVALEYAVLVDDDDAELAALRRRAAERLATVRSHRFQARVAELMALARLALPLATPYLFQRHIAQLTRARGSIVVPLGALRCGRPEEMALLFKVLCDATGTVCRLVRGACADAPGCDYAWAFVRDDAAATTVSAGAGGDGHDDVWLLVDVAAGAKHCGTSAEAAAYMAEGVADGPNHHGAPSAPARPFGCAIVLDSPAKSVLKRVHMHAHATAAVHADDDDMATDAPADDDDDDDTAAVVVLCKTHLPPIDCACGQAEEFGLMVECSRCQRWSHGLCRGLERKAAVPSDFCCWRCTAPALAPVVVGVVPAGPSPLRLRFILRTPSTPDVARVPTHRQPRRSSCSSTSSKGGGSPSTGPGHAGTPGRKASLGLPTPPETPDRMAADRVRRRRSSLAVAEVADLSASPLSSAESSPLPSPLLVGTRDDAMGGAPLLKMRRRQTPTVLLPAVARAGRRRSSAASVADFDIDNVIATGLPAAFVPPPEVKPVFTPGWKEAVRLAPATPRSLAEDKNKNSIDDDDDDDSDSDAHYARLHAPFEQAERRRLPIVVTQERRGDGDGRTVVRTVSAAALHLGQLVV
jgi:hypothetical protein